MFIFQLKAECNSLSLGMEGDRPARNGAKFRRKCTNRFLVIVLHTKDVFIIIRMDLITVPSSVIVTR